MEFARTTDMRLIRSFLSDPRCWHRMRNDSAPTLDRFWVDPAAIQGIMFIVGTEFKDIAESLFLLCDSKDSPDAAEVHFVIAPEAWGRSEQIGRAFIAWVWEHTILELLVGMVPGYNRLCFKLAKAVGFRDCGVSGKVMKHGKEYEVTRMVIGRVTT